MSTRINPQQVYKKGCSDFFAALYRCREHASKLIIPHVPTMLRSLIYRGGKVFHSSQQDAHCFRLCRFAPAAFSQFTVSQSAYCTFGESIWLRLVVDLIAT